MVTPGHSAVKSCRRETELSKYALDLQDQHLDYKVQWSIAQRAAPYKCGTRRCDVCLSEKMVIALADPSTAEQTGGDCIYLPPQG